MAHPDEFTCEQLCNYKAATCDCPGYCSCDPRKCPCHAGQDVCGDGTRPQSAALRAINRFLGYQGL